MGEDIYCGSGPGAAESSQCVVSLRNITTPPGPLLFGVATPRERFSLVRDPQMRSRIVDDIHFVYLIISIVKDKRYVRLFNNYRSA